VKEYTGSYDAYLLAQENAAPAAEKPQKTEKQNDYKLRKERESERRKLNTRISRAEKEIAELDELIAAKTEELSALSDYKKAMELSAEIEELRVKQEQTMQDWEEASLALEEFPEE
ncbi:MAG: ABC transporter ATP-binding protein, partial [Oscillospiraceae bacterium]|nr:ABC transporter ATP-binding protein [Oscillospiraceae bacterium]